jgi:hypothetical protein
MGGMDDNPYKAPLAASDGPPSPPLSPTQAWLRDRLKLVAIMFVALVVFMAIAIATGLLRFELSRALPNP